MCVMYTVCALSIAAFTTLTWWSQEGVWTEKGQDKLQLVLLVNHPCHQQVVADLNQRPVAVRHKPVLIHTLLTRVHHCSPLATCCLLEEVRLVLLRHEAAFEFSRAQQLGERAEGNVLQTKEVVSLL